MPRLTLFHQQTVGLEPLSGEFSWDHSLSSSPTCRLLTSREHLIPFYPLPGRLQLRPSVLQQGEQRRALCDPVLLGLVTRQLDVHHEVGRVSRGGQDAWSAATARQNAGVGTLQASEETPSIWHQWEVTWIQDLLTDRK